MAIKHSIKSTEFLLGVMRDFKPLPNFWLQFFPTAYFSETENIEWSKITPDRTLAHFDMEGIRAPLVKQKDMVIADNMTGRRADLGEIGQLEPMSPEERYLATIGSILEQHRDAIMRRWEWMAAEALLKGSITLSRDVRSSDIFDFKRDANLTVTLTGTALWDGSAAKIIDNLDDWSSLMNNANFGGEPDYLILGKKAWRAFRGDANIKEFLDKDYRNTSNSSIDLGVGSGINVSFKGRISGTLEVWLYNDYYREADRAVVPFMDEKDILMVGRNVAGVRAFGAIPCRGASLRPLAIFPKMWSSNDPSGLFLMTQSAPLMIPINPNNTLKATVVSA